MLKLYPSLNLSDGAGSTVTAYADTVDPTIFYVMPNEPSIRIDPKTNKVTKSIETGVSGGSTGGIAVGQGFVWVTLPGFPITRIDPGTEPGTEKVAQQFWGPGGGAIQFGQGSLWLTNVQEGTLWRIDPKRILATLAE